MILLALNELNIDYIKGYISQGKLHNFKHLFENGLIKTNSESRYDLLEPWIQWVTVQTGLDFEEHKVFRLGDIVDRSDLTQLFEDLESNGLSVGAVSPFNASNNLKNPSFFIPDPWTKTTPSGGFLIKKLSKSISNFVNNNSNEQAGFSDAFWLIIGFLKYVRIKRWFSFYKLLVLRNKPGVKAAILDMILLEVFVTLQKKKKPDYSHLFFNGGAHIQHHYIYNSKMYKGDLNNPEWYCKSDWDPLIMILETYDRIIGDLLQSGETIMGVTGLNQIPHDKVTFYWRPKNHYNFLKELGVSEDFEVTPRMSRDFLIETNSVSDALNIHNRLNYFKDSINNKPVFNIDNRGKSLFIEIVFDKNLDNNTTFIGKNNIIKNLTSKLSFVAIKNGKHHGIGYLFSNRKIEAPSEINLSAVYDIIKDTALNEYKNKFNKK